VEEILGVIGVTVALLIFALPVVFLLRSVSEVTAWTREWQRAWRRFRRDREREWEELAKRLGSSPRPGARPVLQGRIGTYDVTIKQTNEGRVREFCIDGGGVIPRELGLRKERSLPSALGGPDVLLYDPAFDERVRVKGDPAVLFALLTRSARKLVRNLATSGVVVQGGRIHLQVQADAPLAFGRTTKARSLVWILKKLLALAQCLSLREEGIPERLARNAASQDLSFIRLKNLETLQKRFPKTDAARRASLKALGDPNLEIRLRAAMFLGNIDCVARITTCTVAPESLRKLALDYLMANAPAEEVAPILQQLLVSGPPTLQRTAIEGFGRLRHWPAVSVLKRLIPEADRETAIAIAGALGSIGDSSAEPGLLSLLDRDEGGVKVAAARALGLVGTVAAVETLVAYAKQTLDRKSRRAAREAIARIQARLGDVEAGRLAVADVSQPEGALSLSVEPGALSLEEGGRLRSEARPPQGAETATGQSEGGNDKRKRLTTT
jgi:HEAT repeat protein